MKRTQIGKLEEDSLLQAHLGLWWGLLSRNSNWNQFSKWGSPNSPQFFLQTKSQLVQSTRMNTDKTRDEGAEQNFPLCGKLSHGKRKRFLLCQGYESFRNTSLVYTVHAKMSEKNRLLSKSQCHDYRGVHTDHMTGDEFDSVCTCLQKQILVFHSVHFQQNGNANTKPWIHCAEVPSAIPTSPEPISCRTKAS